MKIVYIISAILLLTSCSNKTSEKQGVKNMTDSVLSDSPMVLSNSNEDTIFLDERFLIVGKKGTKLDYLKSSQSHAVIKSKGDTLFHEDTVTILGDFNLACVYVKCNAKYKFSDFSVDKIYYGKLASPKFNKRQLAFGEEYVEFITDGCEKTGINFAGHYTILERDCGCMCLHIFIIDRITGEIIDKIKPNDGRWGYMYYTNSRMLIANSEVIDMKFKGYYCNRFGYTPEFYVWTGKNFTRKE
jgi:hypothetical protein